MKRLVRVIEFPATLAAFALLMLWLTVGRVRRWLDLRRARKAARR